MIQGSLHRRAEMMARRWHTLVRRLEDTPYEFWDYGLGTSQGVHESKGMDWPRILTTDMILILTVLDA